ncbi:hypothetical protein Tco_1130865, partial [Tanacetum coccineum]
MAVIWNPSVRKSVGILIPKAGYKHTIVGFGVCPYTSDPKLVKISVSYKIHSMWEVDVFTLSTRVWKTVYTDLKSEKFDEVCLPRRLVHTRVLDVAKVNESLGLLEYYKEGDMRVCGVWTRNDDANKTFSKIYTVKVVGSFLSRVLEFRSNGEVVMQLDDENNHDMSIELKFMNPCLGLLVVLGSMETK